MLTEWLSVIYDKQSIYIIQIKGHGYHFNLLEKTIKTDSQLLNKNWKF